MGHKLLSLLALLLIVLGSVVTASGRVLNPCTPGLTKEENIIPVKNTVQVYCVSDFGWSDSWFAALVVVYDQSLDLLSGDNAHNLRFSVGGKVVSGTGWFTPGLDAGTFVPFYATRSPWMVTTPVDYIEGDMSRARSVIRHPDYGIEVTITTEVVGDTVIQSFDVMNNGSEVIASIRFTDYFNAHPNGSLPGDANKGTITYFTYEGIAGLWTTGQRDPSWIADVMLVGPRLDDAHDVGIASPFFNGTIRRVEDNAYNGQGMLGPDDVAGALAYDLPDLNPGDSVTFQFTKFIIRE